MTGALVCFKTAKNLPRSCNVGNEFQVVRCAYTDTRGARATMLRKEEPSTGDMECTKVERSTSSSRRTQRSDPGEGVGIGGST